MKTIIFAALMLASTVSSAWWGGYGGYGMGYGYGMPWGAYGAMGYGYAIPSPSFNYTTVIQQSPPIIINNNDPNYSQQPAPYQQPAPRVNPCNYNCR